MNSVMGTRVTDVQVEGTYTGGQNLSILWLYRFGFHAILLAFFYLSVFFLLIEVQMIPSPCLSWGELGFWKAKGSLESTTHCGPLGAGAAACLCNRIWPQRM